MLAIWRKASIEIASVRAVSTSVIDKRGWGLVHRDSPQNNLGIPFDFTPQNWARVKAILSIYPDGYKRAALIPLMDLAQRQHGWLSISAIHKIGDILKVSPSSVFDVSTFYTMFQRQPTGQYHVQVCTTMSCWLRGSDDIMEVCMKTLGICSGETTNDRKFSLSEVGCLGACVNAPLLAVNDDYYEDLTAKDVHDILRDCKANIISPSGPRNGRFASEPKGGSTTLTEEPKGPGFALQESLR